MLRIGLRIPGHFVIAVCHRRTDRAPFALNNPKFIDMEAPSSDDEFSRFMSALLIRHKLPPVQYLCPSY